MLAGFLKQNKRQKPFHLPVTGDLASAILLVKMKIRLTDGTSVLFSDINLFEEEPLWLPGSVVRSSRNDWGNIMIQEFETARYSIRYLLIELKRSLRLSLSYDQSRAQVIYNLHMPVTFHLTNGTEYVLSKGQASFLYDHDPLVISGEQGSRYQVLETNYPESALLDLKSAFMNEPDIIQCIEQDSLHPAHFFTVYASAKITDIFRQIRESIHHPALRPHFFEFKIREMLFQLLLDHERTNGYEKEPDETERLALEKARDIILSDISRHYTISEIARSVQLNEFDLKTGFKKVWGMGIYETLLRARMEKAHELLTMTDLPIKEIAFLTGYPRITSFIRSFRHFFHYTPGSLRRSR